MTSEEFAKQVYLPSLDPRVADLFRGTLGIPGTAYGVMPGPKGEPSERLTIALSLALDHGCRVQGLIDGFGGDPLTLMSYWQQEGRLTVPSITDAVPVLATAPGVSAPNIPGYNDTTFSIKVSIDPADYPKWSGPVVEQIKYVGLRANAEGLYNAINGAENVFVTDQPWEEDGLKFTFRPAPYVKAYYWQLVGRV